MRSKHAALALLASFVLALPSAALSQPSVKDLARAKQLFDKGRADELAAQYGEALKKFEELEKLKPTSGVAFHIGFCKEKLGRGLDAASDYERAAAMAKSENKPEVVKESENRLAALTPKLARLLVLAPKDAQDLHVTVDDRPLPEADLGVEKRIAPGAHKVAATAAGMRPFQSNVDTREGAVQEVRVVLEKAGPAVVAIVAAPKAAEPAPAPVPAAEGPTAPVTPPPDSAPKHANYTGAVIASVATGAFLGLGVASYFVAGAKQDTLLTQCLTLNVAGCDELKGPVRTWDTIALVGFGAAGASLVTAVVLFATASPSKSASARPSPMFPLGLTPEVAIGPSAGTFGFRGALP